MSKDRKKLLHIHSSVNDKQPTPATLELGELGVNNAKGNAFISTKNSDGEVVRFSEDETIIGWMEQKEVFPYEGVVRDRLRNEVLSGTVQNINDLLENKSNIIIKLNQVVPESTDYSPYDEKVNGAKDIYGNPVNPIGTGGYKDGAGFAINMSPYAMIGANPSFSSITTTCHATLNGTTEIKGKGDGCGSKFTVEVANACIDATDTLNEYGVNHSNFGTSCDGTKISNDTTLKGKKIFIDSPSGDLTVDIQACNHISGRTNDFVIRECQDNGGKVEIDTTDIDVSASTTDIKSCDKIDLITDNFRVEQCNNGTTHIHSCSGITLESKNITLTDGNCGNGQTTIEVNDLCLAGEEKVNVYGDNTNVGLDCDDNTIATNTRVFGNGICVNATDRASMYGANKSDLGINCADNDRSTLTRVSGDTVNEGGNIVNTNAETSINETAPTISETATTSINEKAPTITESASTSISETAPNITETASQNITETATGKIVNTATGNVETTSVNAKITENAKTNIEETAGTDITETAGHDITETASHDINNTATNDIYVTAGNKLCEKGKDSYFYGTNSTTIGKGCDDTLSSNITYWRNAEPVCDNGVVGFSATTVDGALDEVYYRSQVSMTSTGNTTGIDVPVPESGTSIVRSGSTTYTIHQDSDGCDKTYDFTVDNTIVSMSAYTYSASEELAKKYTFWQYIGDTRVEIGEINIPKDNILKDASIVNGHASGESFTACTAGDDTCHWYIKLVWNVFDPKTGHADDKIVYLPADDFVKDLVVNNPPNNGVCLDIWYDGQKKNISAHTEVHMIHGNNSTDTKYAITDGCKHSLTSYTLNSVSGDVKTANAATNWTYDPFDKDNKVTITAATDASHINRKTVSWTYGDVKSAAGASYDPGDGTVNTFGNTRTMSFVIPQSVDNINRGTLKVTHNGFTNTYDPASASTWTLPHSSLTATYEATSGKSGSVVFNTSADKNISIPTCVNHLNRHTIKFQSGSTSSFNNQTYDPGKDCANTAETINIPTAVSHLNRGKFTVKHCNQEVTFDPSTDTSITMSHSTLSYTHNGFTGTYDPCTGGTFTAPHSSLTINYGVTCSSSEAVNKTYDTSAAKTIVIPKTISDITGGAVEYECNDNCITVNKDICMQGNTVAAKAFYSKSDRNLKENINSLMHLDYSKADRIEFKSFNFKNDETKTKTYGVIAQDVQDANLSEIVHTDADGTLNVDYISLLILKVASLEDRIKDLSNEIKNLKENK